MKEALPLPKRKTGSGKKEIHIEWGRILGRGGGKKGPLMSIRKEAREKEEKNSCAPTARQQAQRRGQFLRE